MASDIYAQSVVDDGAAETTDAVLGLNYDGRDAGAGQSQLAGGGEPGRSAADDDGGLGAAIASCYVVFTCHKFRIVVQR